MPIESFSQAAKVIETPHAFIHAGETFRYYDSVTLGNGVSQDYWVQTPVSGKRMHLNIYSDGTAVTSFFLFEGTDRAGTTTQTLYNAFRDSATVSGATIKKGTSGGTTDGTQIMLYSSGTATNQSRSGSGIGHAHEWVLKSDTAYIFRITSGTAGNLCNVLFDWYEHESGT